VGTLASYGKEAEHWTFYEVDPNVVRLARTYFSFLADTPAQVDVVVGDARLAVGSAPDGYFGLIVADAFSSDAIPTHLLTRQAIVLYLQKLAPQGLLAFNITNRYVRLGGLLGQQAREAGLLARIRSVPAAARVVATTWVVMARAFPVDLGPNWSDLAAEGKAWTDDYSNLASVVKL
jgi:spermidine synthase